MLGSHDSANGAQRVEQPIVVVPRHTVFSKLVIITIGSGAHSPDQVFETLLPDDSSEDF